MNRRHLMTLRLLLVLSDGVAATLVFLLVSIVRFEADPNAIWSVGIDPGPAAIIFAVGWVVVLWILGLYRLHVRWSLAAEAKDIVKATVVAVALALSSLFLMHQDNVSRVFLAVLFVVQPAVTIGVRALLRRSFNALRSSGRGTSYMLVVGSGALAQTFADRVENHTGLGVRVVGHLTVPDATGSYEAHSSELILTRPVLGTVNEMYAVFHARAVDEVAVCLTESQGDYLGPIIALAADEGKTVRVPRDLDQGILTGAVEEEFEGFLVSSVIHDGHRDLELILKRVVDVLGAAAALVLLSPLLLILAILIQVRDGSPILFRQVRVGRHGRLFTMYKFRTMVVDAEDLYQQVAGSSETHGPAFKMRDDPRTTPLGKALRRSSLDEIPQFLNVLKGEMSLVGPRPAPPREVELYDIWHRRRLSMRPGMTGMWQVGSRIDAQFDDRAVLDLRYIDEWSIWKDLGILLRTVPAVLTRAGH